MDAPPDDQLQRCRARIATLEAENAALRRQAEGVASANVHAALQLLELSEERQRELELKNAEVRSALQVAESASAVKSRFLATLSHELRTPVAGIIGLCDLVIGSRRLADAQEFAGAIARNAESFLDLINQLLDFCKLEANKLELEAMPFDLWDVVEGVAELLHVSAIGKQLEFRFTLAAAVPRRVLGDPLRLRQVLLNLGSNAVKFTSAGSIDFRVDIDPTDEGRIRTSFVDTGCGFDAEVGARLSQPFVQADSTMTRRYGGTGLGLAITRQLVERMGGQLAWQSAVGEGSRFWFDLRLPATDTTPATMPAAAFAVAGFEPAARDYVTGHLQRRGLRLADAAPPDVVLVRAGTDAVSVVNRVRQLHPPPTRLVLLVPTTMTFDDEQLSQLGIQELLREPIRPSRLLDAIVASLHPHEVRPTTSIEPGPAFAGCRVLLAEDTALNRRIALEQLRRFGCIVTEAEDGDEALAHAKQQEFDLILMDLQMPKLDGMAVTRGIRMQEATGKRRRTPIVALTANSLLGDREGCLAAGMDDYLPKPLRQRELLATLERWVPARAAVAAPPHRVSAR